MRVLKSLLLLLFACSVSVAKTQDSTVIVDTTTVDTAMTTAERDTTAFFHADKSTGILQWKERTVPDSTLQHVRSDEAFWYANADFKKRTTDETNNRSHSSFLDKLFQQRWFYNLLWIIIIGSCVAVMILFLIKSNITFFRKAPGAIAGNNSITIPENIFSISYAEEIKKAIAQNDFRLAIRLHFLQALRLLSEKDLIQYQEGFTNSDYLQQLRQTNYYSPFKKLTRHFEYTWYGHFNVAPEFYKTIETDFNTFKNSMSI